MEAKMDVVKKILKEGAHWKGGAYFDGWNEYHSEAHRVYALYDDFVPYHTLRAIAELIRQIPLSMVEKRFDTDREDECRAVLDVISAAEEVDTPASNAAAQMTVAYPNQGTPEGLREKAQKMTENPTGVFFQMGYAWSWK